jgi:hypothetical protein
MILHVHSGDHAANLASQVVEGTHLVYSELLHEGPLPLPPFTDQWYRARASVIAKQGYTEKEVEKKLRSQDEAIVEALDNHEHVVLWFDNCLYDQMILFFILANIMQFEDHQIDLVPCPESLPGYPRISGFGELDTNTIKALYNQKSHLPGDAIAVNAKSNWKTLAGNSIEDLENAPHDPVFPYFKKAAERLAQHHPDSFTGLNKLEKNILLNVLDGCSNPIQLFKRASDNEEFPFFGDGYFFHVIEKLAFGTNPLLVRRNDVITATLRGLRTLWGWETWIPTTMAANLGANNHTE